MNCAGNPLPSVWNVLLAAACAVLYACTAVSAGQAVTGRASVIDGDTIEIYGERIRFNGIDAPESSQLCLDGKGKKYRCGAVSAKALAAFLSKSSPTTCHFVERDRYGRYVGNCQRADGSSIQEWLVENGFALDWERYSGGAYARLQDNARSRNSGMWSGTFENPWDWRANKRAPAAIMPLAAMPAGAQGGCQIKGNISAKGDRIYHLPGQMHYSRTRISESKGERWFCTEGEAASAGWRPAAR